MKLLVGHSGRSSGVRVAAAGMEFAKMCSICPAALSHSTAAGLAIHWSNVSGAKDE